MAQLSEKMREVAYAIGRTRDQMTTEDQKAIVDYVTQEICRIAFGNKSRKQIQKFQYVAQYKREQTEYARDLIGQMLGEK